MGVGLRLKFTFINQTMSLLMLTVLSLLPRAKALRLHRMVRPMIAGGAVETLEWLDWPIATILEKL